MAALTPEQQQWFQEQVAASVRQQTAAQSQQIAQPHEQPSAQAASTRQKQLLEAKIPKPSTLQTEEQWPEWSFKTIAFVAATDPQFAATMEEAEAQAHNENWSPARAPGGERDAELRYLLVALTFTTADREGDARRAASIPCTSSAVQPSNPDQVADDAPVDHEVRVQRGPRGGAGQVGVVREADHGVRGHDGREGGRQHQVRRAAGEVGARPQDPPAVGPRRTTD